MPKNEKKIFSLKQNFLAASPGRRGPHQMFPSIEGACCVPQDPLSDELKTMGVVHAESNVRYQRRGLKLEVTF